MEVVFNVQVWYQVIFAAAAETESSFYNIWVDIISLQDEMAPVNL